jgi:hypothetical protein
MRVRKNGMEKGGNGCVDFMLVLVAMSARWW